MDSLDDSPGTCACLGRRVPSLCSAGFWGCLFFFTCAARTDCASASVILTRWSPCQLLWMKTPPTLETGHCGEQGRPGPRSPTRQRYHTTSPSRTQNSAFSHTHGSFNPYAGAFTPKLPGVLSATTTHEAAVQQQRSRCTHTTIAAVTRRRPLRRLPPAAAACAQARGQLSSMGEPPAASASFRLHST